MAYCPKCGRKNEDDAKFCQGCGVPLTPEARVQRHDYDRECNEECSGRQHSPVWLYFLVAVLVLIIIGIVFSIVVKVSNSAISDSATVQWMKSVPYWDICGLLVALIFVIVIMSMLLRILRR
jgi:uncharacterized membrane protein YvbJ